MGTHTLAVPTRRKRSKGWTVAAVVLVGVFVAVLADVMLSPSSETSTPKFVAPVVSTSTTKQLTAVQIASKMKLHDVRDNTAKNCPSLGCLSQATTDDVTVYTYTDMGQAQKMADTLAEDGFRKGYVVLSYAAQRTPDSKRKNFEKQLTGLVG